jgi:hypothetical protein
MACVHVNRFEDILSQKFFVFSAIGLWLKPVVLKLKGTRANLSWDESISKSLTLKIFLVSHAN